MKIIIGFLTISLGFYIAIEELNQNLNDFWDLIAFAVVVFGTVAVGIITMPSLKLKYTLHLLLRGISSNHGLRDDAILNSINLIQGHSPNKNNVKRIDQKILVDGVDLLRIGFSTEKIKEILLERIEKHSDEVFTIAQWVKGLAKYPPAFGLAGTVLGLIHLMKGLSEGADPKETGLRMAVALVATFYGIIMANVLISPIGDRIMSNLKEDENLAEISLNTIIMISEKVNYLEVLEQLNNYIPGQYKKLDLTETLLKVA